MNLDIDDIERKILKVIGNISPPQKAVVIRRFHLSAVRIFIALRDKHPRLIESDIAHKAYHCIISFIKHSCEQHPADLNNGYSTAIDVPSGEERDLNSTYSAALDTIQDIEKFMKQKEQDIFR